MRGKTKTQAVLFGWLFVLSVQTGAWANKVGPTLAPRARALSSNPHLETTSRVSGHVKGLYASVARASPPRGWTLSEHTSTVRMTEVRLDRSRIQSVFRRASATLSSPDGHMGIFGRDYHSEERHLVLDHAFMGYGDRPSYAIGNRDRIPAWLSAGLPLVQGKGTPTMLYVNLMLMHKLGIELGSLKVVTVKQVTNLRSQLDLAAIRASGATLSDAIRQTNTYQNVETMLTQSGHRILSIDISSWEGVHNEEILRSPKTANQRLLVNYTLRLHVDRLPDAG